MPESFVWQQAEDEEFRLATALRRVSLFIELDLLAEDIERARELFGRLIHRYRHQFGVERLIDRFPALTLVTLIGHAALAYEQNKYWDTFWAELDLPHDAEFENLLRSKLRALLGNFGLREFPELRHQYVQVMAVHAGVPAHCLGDLVDVIEDHIAHGRDPSGAAVFEWLTEPGMEYRLGPLDVPVRNFLRYVGEVAVDIIDRIIDFAAYMLDHPEVANDLDLDTSTTGLPNLLLDELIDRLKVRPFGSATVEPAAVARQRRPVVSYSRIDDAIVLGIPYPAYSPETPWLVSFDGDAQKVYAERQWGYGDEDDQPATVVPVPRRVRQIVLDHPESGAHHRISLIDKDNPLLLFDSAGRQISAHSLLPRDEVIAVYPRAAELLDVRRRRPVPALEECTPAGWKEWRAQVCDLREVDEVRLKPERGKLGPVRQTRPTGAAELELPEPVDGVMTRSGLPVYGERPAVALPCSAAEPTVWRVRVRRSETGDWLADDEWESSDEPTELDPFEGLENGLLGLFDVVVSGPLGADLRHTLFLAEGLTVDHGVEFRLPEGDGLTPSRTELAGLTPLMLDRDVLEFDRTTREAEVRVRSGAREERLVVRPPHIAMRVDEVGAPARWQTAATVLAPEDLTEHAVVAVRVPGDVEVDIVLADKAGELVQIEQPQVSRGNVFHVPTRAFVDTARRFQHTALLARIDTADKTTHRVIVAVIRPPLLCTGAAIDRGRLACSGVRGTDDLAAHIWADTAPWRPPELVPIAPDGYGDLPVDLVDAGPLTVQVFIDDPWSVTPTPARPDSTAVHIDQPGWVTDPDPAREQLSRFLAGRGDPPAGSSALTDVWTVLAGPVDDDHAGRTLRAGLVRALLADPRSSLEALERSTIAQESFPALLIRTGLVEQDFGSPIRLGTAHSNPWLGCLMDIADLPWVKMRSPDAIGELVDILRNLGGQTLLNLLTGDRSGLRTGVFEAQSVVLHPLEPERIDEMKQELEIVPEALLDDSTRQAAMFEAFAQRMVWQSDPHCMTLASGTAGLFTPLWRASPRVHDIVKARNEVLDGADCTTHRWLLMSLQSLLLATLSRLTARGLLPSSVVSDSTREAWARLAELCPAMVGADVLIADALASYELNNNLIGVQP
ncbi:hypothetical protein [Nocardia cyriacigeorgica]|uniref:Uncharacterized protein n=1 Tax=Nocardia cyriacigeorgica TaxID=135487 RepID=A0A5R8NXB4_9NOCA|nr:hypothetical protein [Nocardia cyriacigeorgica]TLF80945.1 hypothetical protein FEK34_04530 [Nocardia cyriacigeorgica]